MSLSNKNNCLTAVKRIVNSLQESVCNTSIDDLMINRLHVYYI